MKRYLSERRDDAHQYPYSYQEIVNRFNRGTLWNRREYELGDNVAAKLIRYFKGKYPDYDENMDEVRFYDGPNAITITDYYLYTE